MLLTILLLYEGRNVGRSPQLSQIRIHPLPIRTPKAWPAGLVAASSPSNERHQRKEETRHGAVEAHSEAFKGLFN